MPPRHGGTRHRTGPPDPRPRPETEAAGNEAPDGAETGAPETEVPETEAPETETNDNPDERAIPVTKHLTRTILAPAAVALVVLLAAACGDSGSSDDTDSASASGDASTETTADSAEPSGATFEFRALDQGGPLTKAALENGDIDIALLFSSDGAIAANDWVALEDDEELQPADNFVAAIRTDANSEEVAAVLDAISGALTVEAMQEMVAAVSIDGENPADVAEAFLADNDLPGELTATGELTVGSANFAESEITAELYAGALESAGVSVERKLQFGAREVYIPALESGELDVVPEFTGTLLSFLDPEAESSNDVDEVVETLRPLAEARGFTVLEPAEADSVNTFVVTAETAEDLGLETVSDLADVEESLVLGGPPECPEREFCLLGLQDVYGLSFDL